MLPDDTDFYGVTDRPWPASARPPGPGKRRVLPELQEPPPLESTGADIATTGDTPCLDLAYVGASTSPHPGEPLAQEWRRWGLATTLGRERSDLAWHAAVDLAAPVRRIALIDDAPSRPALLAELESDGVPLPEHHEGYSVIRRGDTLITAAHTPAGLQRAAAMLASALEAPPGAPPRLHAAPARDWPAIAIRFLGGWALCRTNGLRLATDIAWATRANRVLYNAWGWIPGGRLAESDREHVEYARQRGIELVFELRRMSFGKDYDLREPESRRRILDAYTAAVRHGFRAFGILFDDVPWESAADECALASALWHGLADALGEQPELYCCPQHYWYPGQMNAAWSGRADADETREQRDYLRTWGEHLPRGAKVYLANFWGGHPPASAATIDAEFASLTGRRPVFFDNQIINDYRLGAQLPFPLHERPEALARELDGYYLNCGRPLEVYAPAAATALAWAWNPSGYESRAAMARALAWYHGTSTERARRAAEALERLLATTSEMAGETFTAVDHYRTVWRGVRAGDVQRADIERWRAELYEIERQWREARATEDTAARSESNQALDYLAGSARRLAADLELFDAFFDGETSPEQRREFATRSARIAASALAHVAELLPPIADLDVHLQTFPHEEERDADGSGGELDPRPVEGWSWVEYFYNWTLRALREVRREMLEQLD